MFKVQEGLCSAAEALMRRESGAATSSLPSQRAGTQLAPLRFWQAG